MYMPKDNVKESKKVVMYIFILIDIDKKGYLKNNKVHKSKMKNMCYIKN